MKKTNFSITMIAALAVAIGFSSCKKDVPVTGVTLGQENLLVRVGSSLKLTPSVAPVDATNKEVSYVAQTESVATVGVDGTVTGVSIGQTWVVVSTMEGNFKDSCLITVDPASGSTLSISGNLTADMSLKSDVNYNQR